MPDWKNYFSGLCFSQSHASCWTMPSAHFIGNLDNSCSSSSFEKCRWEITWKTSGKWVFMTLQTNFFNVYFKYLTKLQNQKSSQKFLELTTNLLGQRILRWMTGHEMTRELNKFKSWWWSHIIWHPIEENYWFIGLENLINKAFQMISNPCHICTEFILFNLLH